MIIESTKVRSVGKREVLGNNLVSNIAERLRKKDSFKVQKISYQPWKEQF